MLKSMTGYGRGEAIRQGKKFILELKAVNHRFCEVIVRLPKNMVFLEDRLRRAIQARISRGRVECYFYFEDGKSFSVKVDKELATSYYKAMKELLTELEIPEEITLKDFINLPGVLVIEEAAIDAESWWPVIEQSLEQAISSLLEMRITEGAQLEKDLLGRLERLKELTRQIEDRSPLVVEEYKVRLARRLNHLVQEDLVDSSRLLTEVAIFAERSSITEELVRLSSHLAQMELCLKADEPVGKKMDFLVQEMNREVNTIASKTGDLQISQAVIEFKSELEKMREQIQNVE